MECPEYTRIPQKYTPDDIWTHYSLDTIVADGGYLYAKIEREIYGLKQAAVLAYDHLVDNISSSGYSPIPTTIGMWKHNKIIFYVFVWIILGLNISVMKTYTIY